MLHLFLDSSDGNDTIIIVRVSVVGGVVDGGLGDDTLGFDSIGEVEGSIYLGFENLVIFGGSNTLSGSWDFEDGSTNILAGSLNVDGNLTTTILTVGSASVLEGSGLTTVRSLHMELFPRKIQLVPSMSTDLFVLCRVAPIL